MNQERDKYITEQMGECWHENTTPYKPLGNGYFMCKNCGKGFSSNRNNFSTWEGFGKLWEWSQKQEWWRRAFESTAYTISQRLINPDRFADAVYKFLKE